MPLDTLNIHLVQFSPEWGEKGRTLEKLGTQINSTIQQGNNSTGQQLLVLPEMFSTGFTSEKHWAEPMNGETVQWMQQTAQLHNTAIYGSLLIAENDKLYNRGLFVFPNGDIRHYDKRHCFRMSEEPKHITQGTEIVTVEYAGWRLRLNICYDLRFPVWSRNTYKSGHYNYDILLNVASWTSSRAYIWRTLLHARAIENQAYCIGVNRVGSDAEGFNYRGDSMVVDAKGTALAMANPNEEQCVSVQIKKSSLNEFRQKFCVGADWDTYEITQ